MSTQSKATVESYTNLIIEMKELRGFTDLGRPWEKADQCSNQANDIEANYCPAPARFDEISTKHRANGNASYRTSSHQRYIIINYCFIISPMELIPKSLTHRYSSRTDQPHL